MAVDIQGYFAPQTAQEAVDTLQQCQGNARIIAGGTDLVVDLQAGSKTSKYLVDICGIGELRGIGYDGRNIRIGAAVTHAEIAESSIVRQKALVLAEASASVGSHLTRNQGTLVGNVMNAQPAADGAVALFSLDAQVEVIGHEGTRRMAIEELYQGIGQCTLDSSSELVTAVEFRALDDEYRSSFARLDQRRALSLPVVNVGAVISVRDGSFRDVQIAMGPVAAVPFRAQDAAGFLIGAPVSAHAIDRAAELAMQEAQPRDSAIRGSGAYRQEMVRVLVRRALRSAVEAFGLSIPEQ